ncbi:hypothetical protein MBT42_34740 [Streptomyces sp. MBT42]|uniref:hypothetical protein n=1 Tax=Streptomyces sp. MBT42 TaxID=1488373 RepID=UPI001E5BC825|nr:hypothetical protein [Streptomyces sp. MBT42]MCD2468694.1 hypothetical protein [Streptomyces sp. MBT42]
MAESRPHITVGHHDRYGVVAAASHDNHVAEHILRLVGFERLPGSTLYGLTEPDRDPVRRGAQAVQSLRAARYSVASDVAYDLQPYTRLGAGRGLLDRLKELPAPEVSTVGESVSISTRELAAFAPSNASGHSNPMPSGQQRRAQAATAVSPARAGTPQLRQPAVDVGYRPTATAPQPVRTR